MPITQIILIEGIQISSVRESEGAGLFSVCIFGRDLFNFAEFLLDKILSGKVFCDKICKCIFLSFSFCNFSESCVKK